MSGIITEFFGAHNVKDIEPYTWRWASPDSLYLECRYFIVVIGVSELRAMLDLHERYSREAGREDGQG